MKYLQTVFDENDFVLVSKTIFLIYLKKYMNLDIPCCLLFLIFIICFVILSIFAFQEGIYLFIFL